MTVCYEYPVVCFRGDDYDDYYVVKKHARVRLPSQTDRLFEILITVDGNSLYAVCGTCKKGLFLCLPTQHTGCILSVTEDIAQSITDIQGDFGLTTYEEATVVVYALKKLNLLT